MTVTLRSRFAGRLACDVRFGERLSQYTTYRIGGPAAVMAFPRGTDDVAAALRLAGETGTPWLVLGLGSNVLVADRGFDGMVIRIGKGLDRVTRSGPERSVWTVGAGLPTPLLARQSAAAGHAGVHRLIGVPGTVGGGVFMNAGAHGQDFSLVTRSVDLVEPNGTLRTVNGSDLPWRYRSSGLDRAVVVSATVVLVPGDPARTRDELALYLRKRREGTPFDEPCCGSVFRNPSAPSSSSASSAPSRSAGGATGEAGAGELRTAGQLIDACGLKGFRIGGAEVSPQHANYIVNLGNGTADDVRKLMDAVREKVRARFEIELEPEVKLIGFENAKT